MKKTACLFITLLLLGSTSHGMGNKPAPISLVVVPANFTVMQIAFDLASQYSVVLISYQREAGMDEPVLHAWNGTQWVYISNPDFSAANFIKIAPQRTLVVGEEGPVTGMLVTAAGSWCPEVLNLPSLKTDELVNAFGRLFDFNKSQWNWFAARYQFDLKDLNESRRQQSWYDGPYVDERGRRAGETLVIPGSNEQPVVESVIEETYLEEPSMRLEQPPLERAYERPESPPVSVNKKSSARSEFVIETEPVPVYKAPTPAPVPETVGTPTAVPSFRGWEEKATATEVPLK